ncbi:MAG: hypothetical protein Tsb0034_16600 [Ekhidna sp.]
MRRYRIPDSPLIAAEPAFSYTNKKIFEELIHFDGFSQLKVKGDFLDEIINITNLNVLDLADILEISKPNYYRKRQEPVLDIKTIDKLASLLKIYNQGVDAFGSISDFNRWLAQENLHLGNRAPKLFLKTERGRARLHQAIGRIEHGIYG